MAADGEPARVDAAVGKPGNVQQQCRNSCSTQVTDNDIPIGGGLRSLVGKVRHHDNHQLRPLLRKTPAKLDHQVRRQLTGRLMRSIRCTSRSDHRFATADKNSEWSQKNTGSFPWSGTLLDPCIPLARWQFAQTWACRTGRWSQASSEGSDCDRSGIPRTPGPRSGPGRDSEPALAPRRAAPGQFHSPLRQR